MGEDARRSGSSACVPPRVPVDARGRESRSPRTRPWTPWREARSPRSMQRDDADEARATRASRERSGSSRAYRRAPWIGARGFFADPRVERGARACGALARPRRVGGRRWRLQTSNRRRRGTFLRERLVFRPNVNAPKMTFHTHSVEPLTLCSIPFRARGANFFQQQQTTARACCLCSLGFGDSRAVTPTLTRERRSNFPDSSATTVLLVQKGHRRRERLSETVPRTSVDAITPDADHAQVPRRVCFAEHFRRCASPPPVHRARACGSRARHARRAFDARHRPIALPLGCCNFGRRADRSPHLPSPSRLTRAPSLPPTQSRTSRWCTPAPSTPPFSTATVRAPPPPLAPRDDFIFPHALPLTP